MRATKIIFLTALLVAVITLLAAPTLATIELVSPAADALTNAENITFEYYPSLANIQYCTLTIDNQTFIDTTITSNVFNTFVVAGLSQGSHTWRMSCTDGVITDLSVIRSLTVDRTPPTVTIISPASDTTIQTGALTFQASDTNSQEFDCVVKANTTVVATIHATTATQTVNLSLAAGNYALNVTCFDEAANKGTATIRVRYVPPLFLNVTTDKRIYGLGEPIRLFINSLADAAVSLEVCPDQTGFVHCYIPIAPGPFPETIILPYTNKTGKYFIEAVAIFGNQTKTVTARYNVTNTMRVEISATKSPAVGETVGFRAAAFGNIGAVNYTWKLHNNTVVKGQNITVKYTTIGTFKERVTAVDKNGNTATAEYTVSILPEYLVTFLVKSTTGTVIPNATVQVTEDEDDGSETKQTGKDGKATFLLGEKIYKYFISKDGYGYVVNTTSITKATTITVVLSAHDYTKPVVTILGPINGATVSPPVQIEFMVSDPSQTSCTLSYAKRGDNWLQEGATQTITDTAKHTFSLTSLEEATYTYVIECKDASDNIGKSEKRSFIVTQTTQAQTNGSTLLHAPGTDSLVAIDEAYAVYDSFSSDQKELADLLGWETLIKEQQRIIQRAERDRQALSYRKDLSEQERTREDIRLADSIAAARRAIPMGLTLLEQRSSVEYIKEEELAALGRVIADQTGLPLKGKRLLTYLQRVQQDFTQERRLVRAKIVFADDSLQPISVVSSTFRYKAGVSAAGGTDSTSEDKVVAIAGGMGGSYTLYEVVPAAVAISAAELVTQQEMKTLGQEPLALQFAPEKSITYYVKKDVPLDQLAATRTVLLKKPTLEELNGLTGNVLGIFSFTHSVDWKLSILLTVVFAVIILALRWGPSLPARIRYLFYAESRKKPLHEIRTLINDGLAQLEGGNFDQALLRYKEAKLTYERLSQYAQNEAYDDLAGLKQALDAQYFAVLTERMQTAISEGRFEDAIADYERLEGTYTELPADEQERLVAIVYELGRKLGFADANDFLRGELR